MPHTVSSFAEIEQAFIERAHTAVWCSVATVDRRGRPRSRVLHPYWEGAIGWIATNRNSLKSKHLIVNPFVSVAYLADPFKPVYAECRAEWADDPATKRRVWELFKNAPEPLGYDPASAWSGVEDPQFGVLRLAPMRIELYDLLQQHNRVIWRAAEI